MTQVTGTHSTYDAVGNREDLVDMIYFTKQAETPFLSSLTRTAAEGVKHEWQLDELDAASAANAVVEGDEATGDTANITTRPSNYCQIADKVPVVTGTQEAVKKAGRASEMAYQVEYKTLALKRDVEAATLANQARVVGTDTAARRMAGAQAWIVANQNIASDATAATGDGTDAHTDGTARALTEAMFEEVLGECWDSGGNPTTAILGKAQKQVVAGFSGNATRTHDGEGKKITNAVDIYIDPLGSEVRLVPCRQAPTDVVYFFDMDYVKLATLREFTNNEIASTGDYYKRQIIWEGTLQVGNQNAHGIITDLS